MSGCIDTMYSGGNSLNSNTVGVRMLILVSANDQKDSNISMHTAFNGGAFQHCIAGQDFGRQCELNGHL